MELTQRERDRLRQLVEEALRIEPREPTLAVLAAKLAAAGGPAFDKYSEVLEAASDTNPEILALVREAMESNARLAIRYTARSTGETTERIVRPFNMHFYDGQEYLEAFCELRDADRLFAIGNIEAILTVPAG